MPATIGKRHPLGGKQTAEASAAPSSAGPKTRAKVKEKGRARAPLTHRSRKPPTGIQAV